MRILIRPRRPVLALLLLAPSIPELLTGSTPVTRLVYDPFGFAVSYALDIGLYGTGALLIREASVALRKGWASVLLWGAAYGIAEEGFAVHTFFQPGGTPVGALATYGSAFGVNWLWALGLTVFHATYSIALPILLTYLWFPWASQRRWLDRASLSAIVAVYLGIVGLFAHLVGHGPSVGALALFLAVVALLLVAGYRLPRDLLRARDGPTTAGRWSVRLAGAVEWIAWLSVLILSRGPLWTAWLTGAGMVLVDGATLVIVGRSVGRATLERTEFDLAVGMLVPLFLWDLLLEPEVPGILLVAALFAYLLYRLGRSIALRSAAGPVGAPASGP